MNSLLRVRYLRTRILPSLLLVLPVASQRKERESWRMESLVEQLGEYVRAGEVEEREVERATPPRTP